MLEMNVLLVSPLPPPVGGIASWTVDYMNYCDKHGIDITLVNSAIKGSRATNVGKRSLIEELKRCLQTRKEIKAALKAKKHDVLHYCASCSTVGLIRDFVLLCGLKIPVVYHCHCDLSVVINNGVAQKFFGMICKKAAHIFALNTPSLNTALQYTPNASYLPNFALEVFEDEKEIKENLKKIIYVGRVTKEKGIRELITASEKLPEKEFIIVGPPDDEDIVFPENSNITVLGRKPHEETIELMKKSDVLILPSYSEGFPLSVLEGMSCGLPIIATNVGAIPDMIGEVGGCLIEKENAGQIVDAIKSLEEKDIRQKMSICNTEKVKNCYQIDVVVKQITEIYKQVQKKG